MRNLRILVKALVQAYLFPPVSEVEKGEWQIYGL
jgi:hypothetical protein